MRFGTFHLHSIPPWSNDYDVIRQQFEQMLAAERHGLHEVWLAEHNGRRYGMVGNTVQLASAVAAATTRIRIATAVSRLPLHHPLHLAEDLAYADVLSNGRVDWGVGKGYDRLEFGSYGTPYDEREDRWQETLDAVLQIWRSGRTEFKGRFYELEDATLFPRPFQRPTPPIYVMVSGSERSISWAAEHLFPIASGSGPTPEQLRERLDKYAQLASDAGHPDALVAEALANCWQLKPMHIAATTPRAVAEYREGVEWYMGELNNRSQFGFARDAQPYEYYVEHEAVVLGSSQKVIDDLGSYCERSGVNNVICWVNMGGQPHGQVLDALARLGEEVMPQLASVRHVWGPGASVGRVAASPA